MFDSSKQQLKFRVGQIVGINGCPSLKEIIVARLSNPDFSTYEAAYMLLDTNTLLCPTMKMECIINDSVVYDASTFDIARTYEITNEGLKSRYESILNIIQTHKEERKRANGKDLEFEVISEEEFCSLLEL